MADQARATMLQRAHPSGLPDRGRCLVMGVVNVTPDSFSDGGAWFAAEAAVSHGLQLAAEGADIVDVGGESTRPGAGRVGEEEELRRVAPVIAELARAGLTVSVDTMPAAVAEFAIGAGARMVNDVSGGRSDPRLPRLIAEAGAPHAIMHSRGPRRDMQGRAGYDDGVPEDRYEVRPRGDAGAAPVVGPSASLAD